MGITKPRTMSGILELFPEEQIYFEKILDIIRYHFELHAFYPLDTTILERSDVLLAKGGGETEQQIYRFERGSNDISLRFDLTVPLARYTAQNFSDLEFPFFRYQIGKVYRAERAQKGRYREFYQCDVDIIGRHKLDILHDAEIPSVMDGIFQALNLPKYRFHINNRQILNGLLNDLDVVDTTSVLRVLDKLDKIGSEKMVEELLELGLNEIAAKKLKEFGEISGDNNFVLKKLGEISESEEYKKGILDLITVYEGMKHLGIDEDRIKVDPSITRGLDYYTGTVYETFISGYEDMGSICSGGRYDDLASHYIKENLPGVGMSIGLSRLFTLLKENNLLNIESQYIAEYGVLPFPGAEFYALEIARKLREVGKKTLVLPDKGRLGRKLQTLDKRNIPYAIILGDNEMNDKTITIRDLSKGEQETIALDKWIKSL